MKMPNKNLFKKTFLEKTVIFRFVQKHFIRIDKRLLKIIKIFVKRKLCSFTELRIKDKSVKVP